MLFTAAYKVVATVAEKFNHGRIPVLLQEYLT